MFNLLGWTMGIEPTPDGITIRCSTNLSYVQHIYGCGAGSRTRDSRLWALRVTSSQHRDIMVMLPGLEPEGSALKGRCVYQFHHSTTLVREVGVEPTVYLTSRIYSPLPSPLGILPVIYWRRDRESNPVGCHTTKDFKSSYHHWCPLRLQKF